MRSINSINGTSTISVFDLKSSAPSQPFSEKKDSAEISNTAKVMNNIDKFFNLGSDNRTQLSDMNPAEQQEFIKMTADLIKHGVMGYEVLDVNHKPEKHDIVLEIGDQRIKGAKLYKKQVYYKD